MGTKIQTTVVISTLNRPQDVRRLLDTLTRQSVLPAHVVIVDQSDDDRTRIEVDAFREKIHGRFEVTLLPGPFRSLTRARNLGAAAVTTPVTTFLDDDVEIGEKYLSQVLDFFAKDQGALIGGVPWPTWPKKSADGGLEPPPMEQPSPLWTAYRKLFGLGYPTRARWQVLPSFEGTFNPVEREPVPSEWVSGSNFSVLTSLAQGLKFDGNLLGYSIGEDLDFPLRVLKERPGSVWIDPRLPVIHHASAIARLDSDNLLMMKACHHYYLSRKHWGHDPLRMLAFAWARLGFVLMPSLQGRVGPLPDLKLLLRSLTVEARVLGSLGKVSKGSFLYKVR